MGVAEWVALAVFVMGAIFARFTYLLDQKDKSQEKEIEQQGTRHDNEIRALEARFVESNRVQYKLHEDDARLLSDVRLELARNYHPKEEITAMMLNLKKHIDDRFDSLERHMGMERRDTEAKR